MIKTMSTQLNIELKKVFDFSECKINYFNLRPGHWAKSDDIFLPLQVNIGSDHYGPVLFCNSSDRGRTWSEPAEIPGFGSNYLANGYIEAFADCVAFYHQQTDKMILLGGNTYYKADGGCVDTLGMFGDGEKAPDLPVYSAYGVLSRGGHWGPRQRMFCPGLSENNAVWSLSAQVAILEDGKMLIPAMVSSYGENSFEFKVIVQLCDFDGEKITVLQHSEFLRNPVGRGLIEPSIFEYQGLYYLTLRAEDNHGYYSVSRDGLTWGPIQPWRWKDGAALEMSSTQQHWATLGGKLYLLYTRRNGANDAAFRWRIPVYIAEVDVGDTGLSLKQETEQIIFGPRGAYGKCHLIGNYQPLQLSENEVLVGAGEETLTISDHNCGDAFIARITL